MSKRSFAVRCAAALLGALPASQILAANAESTSVGGRLFLDFSYIDQKSNGVKTDASGVGTDVKRAYLIVNHSFDEVWSANVTTDFNYVSSANFAQVFIKKAYVQAKVSDAFAAQLGSADLPWVLFAESFYGYRYIEKLLIDRLSFGTTADWGLHVNGKLADNTVSYAVSVINGNGYRNTTRSKSVDVEGRIGYSPIQEVTIGAGFYRGKRGQQTETQSTANTASRFDALVAFVNPQWRLGAEYFYAKDWGAGSAGTTVPTAAFVIVSPNEDKADGFSLWGAYNLDPSWSVFARADVSKPSKDLHPDLKDRYYNAGLAWHANKKIDVALAVKREKVENGIINAYNGDITKTPKGFDGQIGGSVDGTYTEGGVWVLVNF